MKKLLLSLVAFYSFVSLSYSFPIIGYVQVNPLGTQPGGFNISSGTVGTLTDTGLSANQCVQTGSGGLFTTTGQQCGAGGGGPSGASLLQVTQNGVQITSPTSSMNFSGPPFILGAVGSTSTITLDASSVTLQGNSLLISNMLSQSSATTTYLQQSNAASTYLTQANASANYLLQSVAVITYAPISGSTNYIQNTNSLQSGSQFSVANGAITDATTNGTALNLTETGVGMTIGYGSSVTGSGSGSAPNGYGFKSTVGGGYTFKGYGIRTDAAVSAGSAVGGYLHGNSPGLVSVGVEAHADGTGSENDAAYLSAGGGTANHAINLILGDFNTNGTPGTAGQILQSNGSNNVPTWVNNSAGGGLPLPGGATNYVQITNSLQASSTYYVSSGTVNNLNAGVLKITSIGEFLNGSGPCVENSDNSSLDCLSDNGVSGQANWQFPTSEFISNVKFDATSPSQFVNTNASNQITSYNLFGGTNTWTGNQTMSNNSSSTDLTINKTNNGGSIFNLGSVLTNSSTGAGSGTGVSIYGSAQNALGASNNGSATETGIEGVGTSVSSGATNGAYGVQGIAVNSGTGTLTNQVGVYSQPSSQGGGITTNSYGFYTNTNDAAGSTTTTHADFYGANPTEGSKAIIQTNYGMYLENQTAGNTNYGIYEAGGNNVFSGPALFSSPSQSTFTYGVTAGSVTVNGIGNGLISLTISGSTYTVTASSTVALNTVGHLAVWSSTNGTLSDGGVLSAGGGGGGGSLVNLSALGNVPYYSAAGSSNTLSGSSLFQFNGTSVTVRSSMTFTNTGPDPFATEPVVGIYGSYATDVPLFEVGTVATTPLFVIKANDLVDMSPSGAKIGNLQVGGRSDGDNTGDPFSLTETPNTNATQGIRIYDPSGNIDIGTTATGSGGKNGNINFIIGTTGLLGAGTGTTEVSISSFGVTVSTSMIISSTGSVPSLAIYSSGSYGTNNATSGGFYENCTGGGAASGFCANFYSNAGAQNALGGMVNVINDSSTWNEPEIYTQRLNNTNNNSDIRVEALGTPAFTMNETGQANASAGKFQFSIHNGDLRIEGRNAANTAFDSGIIISSMASFGDVAIGQGYDFSSNTQLQVISSTKNVYAGTYSTSTVTSGPYILDISTTGHLNSQSVVGATVTSCGTAPSFTGSDIAATITTGSGSPTTCNYTFARPFTNAPTCVVSDTLDTAVVQITSISNATVTMAFSAALNSGKIFLICIGSD